MAEASFAQLRIAIVVVTDNGPAFKSIDFGGFIRARPFLRHVRTRHHAPETNGIVERFNRSLKYEHRYREEIADVLALDAQIQTYRELYNWVRPHETLGLVAPMVRYLGEPPSLPVGSHLSEPEICPDFLTRNTDGRWRKHYVRRN